MTSGPRLWLLLAFFVGAGFLAGRTLWQPTPAPPQPAPAVRVTTVPAFELQDLASGARRSIRDWSAEGLIINFWATWCAPCREEMPLLEQVHQLRQGQGIAVVGIAVDRLEPVRTFIGETGISYPILVGLAGEQDAMAAAESFGPEFVGLPLTVVAAPGGDILTLHTGALRPADLDLMVEVLDQLAARRLTVAQARKRLGRT